MVSKRKAPPTDVGGSFSFGGTVTLDRFYLKKAHLTRLFDKLSVPVVKK